MSYGMSYGGVQGDPFLGGIFKRIKRGITGFVSGGPLGAVGGFLGGGNRQAQAIPGFPMMETRGRGMVVPRGGAVISAEGKRTAMAAVAAQRPRRRINPANPKALRRAIRRQDGFVKLARRALKGSGYTIVSRGSQRRKGPSKVVETGPGSVHLVS